MQWCGAVSLKKMLMLFNIYTRNMQVCSALCSESSQVLQQMSADVTGRIQRDDIYRALYLQNLPPHHLQRLSTASSINLSSPFLCPGNVFSQLSFISSYLFRLFGVIKFEQRKVDCLSVLENKSIIFSSAATQLTMFWGLQREKLAGIFVDVSQPSLPPFSFKCVLFSSSYTKQRQTLLLCNKLLTVLLLYAFSDLV